MTRSDLPAFTLKPAPRFARIDRLLHSALLSGLLLGSVEVLGQSDHGKRGLFFGVGMGQDVGGIIGARATYWVAPFLSGFVGGGWALVDPAYNAGIELRVPSARRGSFFVTGMYGYNAAIRIEGKEELNALYYGPTVGAGLILNQRTNEHYWRFSVNLPFRPNAFEADWQAIKDRPNIEVNQEAWPITLGIGFHFNLH